LVAQHDAAIVEVQRAVLKPLLQDPDVWEIEES
jgi:hypothetical protein